MYRYIVRRGFSALAARSGVRTKKSSSRRAFYGSLMDASRDRFCAGQRQWAQLGPLVTLTGCRAFPMPVIVGS